MSKYTYVVQGEKNLGKAVPTSPDSKEQRGINSFAAWFSVTETLGFLHILGLAMWHTVLKH